MDFHSPLSRSLNLALARTSRPSALKPKNKTTVRRRKGGRVAEAPLPEAEASCDSFFLPGGDAPPQAPSNAFSGSSRVGLKGNGLLLLVMLDQGC